MFQFFHWLIVLKTIYKKGNKKYFLDNIIFIIFRIYYKR